MESSLLPAELLKWWTRFWLLFKYKNRSLRPHHPFLPQKPKGCVRTSYCGYIPTIGRCGRGIDQRRAWRPAYWCIRCKEFVSYPREFTRASSSYVRTSAVFMNTYETQPTYKLLILCACMCMNTGINFLRSCVRWIFCSEKRQLIITSTIRHVFNKYEVFAALSIIIKTTESNVPAERGRKPNQLHAAESL